MHTLYPTTFCLYISEPYQPECWKGLIEIKKFVFFQAKILQPLTERLVMRNLRLELQEMLTI